MLNFFLEEYVLPDPEAEDPHLHTPVPIFLELPFFGFMPEGHAVTFSASLTWTDNTTDDNQVAPVTLVDTFSFSNGSSVPEAGNYGGTLASSGSWGGLTANAGDFFTVTGAFDIEITGPGTGPAASIGLSFFDQVAIDNGLLIPEPGTMVLALVSVMAWVARRQRKVTSC